ncbi:MAG: hypothetical protein KDK37_12925 [Leptospiraceae bacterium]|nr:hypothetical protein [Leptospiraceae bacterium]
MPSELRLPSGWTTFSLPHPGTSGSFDPSFASGDGQDWVAYSVVDPSYHWPLEHPHTVSTRVARRVGQGW